MNENEIIDMNSIEAQKLLMFGLGAMAVAEAKLQIIIGYEDKDFGLIMDGLYSLLWAEIAFRFGPGILGALYKLDKIKTFILSPHPVLPR